MIITIRRADDMHVHLRDGAMLRNVAKYTGERFARALVMPNLTPPVLTGDDASRYKGEILNAVGDAPFEPLMTIKIVPATTPELVRVAKSVGVVAGKLYPEGVTTNSEDGVSDIQALYPVFAEMEAVNMVLSLHGEHPTAFCLDREAAFLSTLQDIARSFPKLRIVLEHVTTEAAIECVKTLPDTVAATITVHHLMITLDDVIGGKLKVHNFCKPIAKLPSDRDSLRWAATSGNPKFFLGTDSAPHAKHTKECAEACAGCYTAPIALEMLATAYEQAGYDPARMEGFSSESGARFYQLPLNEGSTKMIREIWTVPDEVDGVVPFWAGRSLAWRLA